MDRLVIEDEQASTALVLQRLFIKCKKDRAFKKYNRVFFAGDDNFICDYLMTAVNKNVYNPLTSDVFKSVQYISASEESDYRKNTLTSQNVSVLTVDDFEGIKENKNLVFFFADTTDLQRKEATIESLKAVQKLLCDTKNSRCVVVTLLPKIEVFPSEATALSERELNFFMEKVCKRTPESEYYFEIEKMCRGFVRDNNSDITLLRFDNVFAPDRFHTPSFDLKKVISDAAKIGKLTINDEDESLITTASYIRNACYAVFASAFVGLKGHIYNVAYNAVSLSDIKQCVYSGYKEHFSLSIDLSENTKKQYNALNDLVFRKLKIKRVMSLQGAINYVVAFFTGYACPNMFKKYR